MTGSNHRRGNLDYYDDPRGERCAVMDVLDWPG